MDKIKIAANFAPELSECTLHLFSYISLHGFIVLINFCYTALGFLLLQWSSGVVLHPRDLQVSVATRSCRVLIFASS